MTEIRYTITLGKNNEFKEIIDHCKGDKHISVFDFLKQVNEQDMAFKKLKEENEELKKENVKLQNSCNLLEEENNDLNKFFLYACKTTEYLKWKKELSK